MRPSHSQSRIALAATTVVALTLSGSARQQKFALGSERAVPEHLTDASLPRLTVPQLIDFGRTLFLANWTE